VNSKLPYQLPHALPTYLGQEARKDARSMLLFGPFGSRYEVGRFRGEATFGTKYIMSEGNGDIFVTKHSNAGTLLWVSTFGGPGDDAGSAIASDVVGNIFVAGHFSEVVNFGAIKLKAVGACDAFVAMLNSTSGGVVWAAQAGGLGTVVAYGVAADPAGNSYVVGAFERSAVFGNLNLTSRGKRDAFMMKLGATGNVAWAGQLGGIGDDAGEAVSVGLGPAADKVFVTGYFSEAAAFGLDRQRSVGSGDMFVIAVRRSLTEESESDGQPLPYSPLDPTDDEVVFN